MASQPSDPRPDPVPPLVLKDVVRGRVRRDHLRIHWMALGSAGIRPGETIVVPREYDFLGDIAEDLGCIRTTTMAQATIIVLARPNESDLLNQISKLVAGRRLIVYNDERDIDAMPERCFDLVTACVFDRESKKVVRVFDPIKGGKRTCVDSYVNVELTDINDSSLSIHASRIAALR